jgi:hypothetical protein
LLAPHIFKPSTTSFTPCFYGVHLKLLIK